MKDFVFRLIITMGILVALFIIGYIVVIALKYIGDTFGGTWMILGIFIVISLILTICTYEEELKKC